MEVAGESHYLGAIKALVGAGVRADGSEIVAAVQLVPEPLNKHDRNAVGVWGSAGQIGYLPREEAGRYSAVLMELVARGWTPQVSARIWAAHWPDRRDGFSASVRLELAEPHMLVPANRAPGVPHELLPVGAAIQVTGEENHLADLAQWLRPEGECWVHATLHEVTEQLARSTRTVVEVRIDGRRVGQLTPRMSGELLAAVRHLDQRGMVSGARAIVKGNRIKTEVVLYVARAHELPDSWLASSPESTHESQPLTARPVARGAASAPMASASATAGPPPPMSSLPPTSSAPVTPAPAMSESVARPIGSVPATPVPYVSAAHEPTARAAPVSVEPVVLPAGVRERQTTSDSGGYRFNAPPNWPEPPPGWSPPPGWLPDPGWGPLPPGWQLWIEDSPVDAPVPSPVVPSPQVPELVALSRPVPTPVVSSSPEPVEQDIPLFGARGKARELAAEVTSLRAERDQLRAEMDRLGLVEIQELEAHRRRLRDEIAGLRAQAAAEQAELQRRLADLRRQVVVTEEKALLQEAGIYNYQHPLGDSVAYQDVLATLQEQIKTMAKADGGAILAASGWTVNGSAAQGRTMLRDYSKLMLRAYNAEADNLVRTLKPYKLQAAVERLGKVAATIARLGKTMDIRVSEDYHRLRVRELGLTADYQEKLAEEKERDREEKARLREERRLQQEIDRERARLDKERQHYANAVAALQAQGDSEGLAQLQQRLEQIDAAIQDVDYRAANVRAGYVYVISNVGAFGEKMIKVGMTRRLEPMDRVRELGDASVPFLFDVHALFFSDDAVGIEAQMHARLADRRVNLVNQRREFFHATPAEARQHLTELAGNLLQYEELPEALEYRQSLTHARKGLPAPDAG